MHGTTSSPDAPRPDSAAPWAASLDPVVQVLRPDGSADPGQDPVLDADETAALYAQMRRLQLVDQRLGALSDAGEIGFLPSTRGREAAIAGAMTALSDGDWVFGTTGDWGAVLSRGYDLGALLHRVHGSARDPLSGRDMPGAMSARLLHIASSSAPAATHLPQAVGLAWAAQRRGHEIVASAWFDAEDIDAADFHTGLNFAGVMKAPVVFVCRGRRGSPGAAEHAVAYGLGHARCDGDDALAVVRALRGAAECARGGAPCVVDLLMDDSVGDDAEDRGGVARLRAHLEGASGWDDAREAALVERTTAALDHAIAEARAAAPPAPASLFDHVFARPLPHLVQQRDELVRGPRPPAPKKSPGSGA